MHDLERLRRRLQREIQARKQAEGIAEASTRELYQTNAALQRVNSQLEELVRQRTQELSVARDEAAESNKAKSAAQQELQATQYRFRHLVTSSPAVIFSYEAGNDHRHTFVTDNIRELSGYEPYEFLAGPSFWASRVHAEDYDQIKEQYSDLLELGTLTQEYRFRHQDGGYRWLCENLQLLRDAEGVPVEVVGSLTDISERKAAEGALRLLQIITRAANESLSAEDAMQIALDEICSFTGWPIGHALVLARDGSGDMVSSGLWHLQSTENLAIFREATGGGRWKANGKGLVGRVLAERKAAWLMDVTAPEANFVRCEQAYAIGIRAGFAFPVLAGREVVAVLEFFAEQPREPNEVVLDLMTQIGTQLGRAIERSRSGEQLRRAKEEAEAATRAKSRFLASMSHELRTPLNAIIGVSEMLCEDAEELGYRDFDEPLQRIIGAGRHLLHLINEILDLSKVEAGKVELHLETFDVRPLVEDALSTTGPIAERNANRVEATFAPDLGAMNADLTRVRQVVLNLLSNACKFTQGGQIEVAAVREPAPAGDRLVLTVSDTGIGMSAAQRERLFEEFSQGDSSTTRRYGGTGLGLAISHRFCRLMGGEISVRSAPGQGSTFVVRLPMQMCGSAPGSRPEPAQPSTHAQGRMLAGDRGGERPRGAGTSGRGAPEADLARPDDAGDGRLRVPERAEGARRAQIHTRGGGDGRRFER